jgi:integrase
MDDKSITILDTKNKDTLELPLSDYLLEILQRRKGKDRKYVFPIVEVKKFVAWVRNDSGVEFTIHDLRRTFATYAEELNIGGYTIKAMLNHRIGGGDVTAGYIRVTVERMREPMQKVTDYVLGYAGVKVDNVVAIGKAKTK